MFRKQVANDTVEKQRARWSAVDPGLDLIDDRLIRSAPWVLLYLLTEVLPAVPLGYLDGNLKRLPLIFIDRG